MAMTLVATRSVARTYVFPAPRAVGAVPADVVVDSTWTRSGIPVRALELRAHSEDRTIVHFHNNRQTAEDVIDLGRALRDLGFNVVLTEYRGYGASRADRPSEEGLYEDAEAVLDLLATRGITSDRIVLWGTSLGTGVAAEMARRGRGSRLVLVSPYTAIPDLVSNLVPLLPARFLVPDQFDTRAKTKEICIPALVVHGDSDEIVPLWMGEMLARAPKRAPLAHRRRASRRPLLPQERGGAVGDCNLRKVIPTAAPM
jgi:fermentation-respiration switch protein FrsA (DUF1100 family)